MKKIFFGIGLLALIASFGYCAESKSPVGKADKPSPLTLTIAADKEVYAVGEEINLEVNIMNIGKNAAKIYSPDYWGVSDIVVINSQGTAMKPEGIKVEREYFDDFMSIPSNGVRTHIYQNLE